MPLPPLEVTDLAEVAEEFRNDYTETDGKYLFDFDKHVAGLKNGLKAEREQRRTATEKLTGLTAELDALKAAPPSKSTPKDDDRIAKLEKMIADERAAREAKEQELRTRDDRDTLRRAFLAAGGLEEDADDVLTLTQSRFARDESGALIATADDPLIKTPQEFFAKEFRAARPKFFKAQEKSGGGASPGRTGGAGAVKTAADLSGDEDKAAYIKQHGYDAYRQLVDRQHTTPKK